MIDSGFQVEKKDFIQEHGIGNKISLINLLSENDVAEIVEELHQYSLI